MKCEVCGREVSEEMLYCPECGNKLKHQKYCHNCGTPLLEDDEVCPICGSKQRNINTFDNDDPYRGYWKKPHLWIISILLIGCGYGLYSYMMNNVSRNTNINESNKIEISGSNDEYVNFTNMQLQGKSLINEDKIYLVVNEKLYRYNLDLSNREELVNDCSGYLSIDNNYLYYCDSDYTYHSYDLKSKEDIELLDDVYYPTVKDNVLYYQQDVDNESIHIYNIDNKEDTKVNDETSYNITVDYNNKKFYYTTKDDKFKSINFDGNDEKTLLDNCGTTFVIHKDLIYVTSDDGLIVMDLDGSNQKSIISDTLDYINIYNDKLIYLTANGLKQASLNGKDIKVIYSGNKIQYYQVAGDKVIVYGVGSDYQEECIVIDDQGNSQAIEGTGINDNESDISSEIDGARDF